MQEIQICFKNSNHVIIVQWYHEMNNGSMRLLRTGATQGNPYGYTVRVRQGEIQIQRQRQVKIQQQRQVKHKDKDK